MNSVVSPRCPVNLHNGDLYEVGVFNLKLPSKANVTVVQHNSFVAGNVNKHQVY